MFGTINVRLIAVRGYTGEGSFNRYLPAFKGLTLGSVA